MYVCPQINNIEESTDYIRKVVLADARDALNTALVRDEVFSSSHIHVVYFFVGFTASDQLRYVHACFSACKY